MAVTTTAAATTPAARTSSIDCAPYEAFGDLTGKKVTVYTSIPAPEDAGRRSDSYKLFTDCTGVTVNYEGSDEFEAQLAVRVEGGNAPDIAFIPQPGLLKHRGRAPARSWPPPTRVSANVDKNYAADWKDYGTVDGTFYAAPLGANVKSFVWYSPKIFEDNGWAIPTTWDELLALSDKIAADGHQALVRRHRVR